MKKLSCLLLALAPMWVYAQERIMVIADPHVLPQTLIEADPNFDVYMQTQRKMLDLSEETWYALMDTACLYQPDLVLIPGDLTRDAEPESHSLVAASLQQLNDAGIQTLVIPGNHDIVSGTNWEEIYGWVYEQATAKDANSHSYVAEPLEGLTVLGIDGSHEKASVGSLSASTLAWLLDKADAAKAKGHMIIAMCHWQLLEHIDKQQKLESSCRLKDADAIRDSLMHHGVHVVLTGHFHVNGITTYRDSLSTNDSIVEITTGSPITYPCPYRWLTLSKDRKTVVVETDLITALESQPDLQTYSRDWMAEHARNMLPQMSLRLWNRVDDAKDKMAQYFPEDLVDLLINTCMPQTDSAKMALVEKYMGPTIVDLYLLHSDANEPEHPEADVLAKALYSGMDDMIDDMLSANAMVKYVLGSTMKEYARSLAQEPVQSLVEDKTQWATAHPDRTDDLRLTLTAGNGYAPQALEQTETETGVQKILQDGQLLIIRDHKTYTLQGQVLK